MIKYGRCYLKYEHRLSNEEAQIIPVSQGGTNDESNLMLVCKECHHRIHKKK